MWSVFCDQLRVCVHFIMMPLFKSQFHRSTSTHLVRIKELIAFSSWILSAITLIHLALARFGSVRLDSIRFGPTQFSSLCFNSSQSNSISIDFDSLTSFHRNINHVRSAALAHYLSLSCSPDPVLHRSGKYVFQVQYMNTQNVIDYEMVNFMACSTHTTFPGIVELLS